jgi:hypothetical protein
MSIGYRLTFILGRVPLYKLPVNRYIDGMTPENSPEGRDEVFTDADVEAFALVAEAASAAAEAMRRQFRAAQEVRAAWDEMVNGRVYWPQGRRS